MRLGIAVAALTFSCAASTQRPIGYGSEAAPSEATTPSKEAGTSAEDELMARERPVRALRLPENNELAPGELARELLENDAICVGEQHAQAPHHYAEAWLLELLATRASIVGLELGVGFEMFQYPFQHALSAFQSSAIEEEDLLRRTEYAERWGYPIAFYRPLLEQARDRRLGMVALNAPKELTREVAKSGIDGLGARRAYELPELDLNDEEHRADFQRRMRNHPGLRPESLDRYYQAQVLWDEVMAERAASWLIRHAPVRRLMIVAGQAHCQRSAIPARIERRGAGRVKSVLLSTQEPTAELAERFDYVLIVGAP